MFFSAQVSLYSEPPHYLLKMQMFNFIGGEITKQCLNAQYHLVFMKPCYDSNRVVFSVISIRSNFLFTMLAFGAF